MDDLTTSFTGNLADAYVTARRESLLSPGHRLVHKRPRLKLQVREAGAAPALGSSQVGPQQPALGRASPPPHSDVHTHPPEGGGPAQNVTHQADLDVGTGQGTLGTEFNHSAPPFLHRYKENLKVHVTGAP